MRALLQRVVISAWRRGVICLLVHKVHEPVDSGCRGLRGAPDLCPRRAVQPPEISDWRCFLCSLPFRAPCTQLRLFCKEHSVLPLKNSRIFWQSCHILVLSLCSKKPRPWTQKPPSLCCEHQKIQEGLLALFLSPNLTPLWTQESGQLCTFLCTILQGVQSRGLVLFSSNAGEDQHPSLCLQFGGLFLAACTACLGKTPLQQTLRECPKSLVTFESLKQGSRYEGCTGMYYSLGSLSIPPSFPLTRNAYYLG